MLYLCNTSSFLNRIQHTLSHNLFLDLCILGTPASAVLHSGHQVGLARFPNMSFVYVCGLFTATSIRDRKNNTRTRLSTQDFVSTPYTVVWYM